MESERWIQIPGFEQYEISSFGRVRKIKGKGFLSPNMSGRPGYEYPSVRLFYGQGRARKLLLHKLVYVSFCGDVPEGHQIDHKDRNRMNARLDNLRAVTAEENQANKLKNLDPEVESILEELGINV